MTPRKILKRRRWIVSLNGSRRIDLERTLSFPSRLETNYRTMESIAEVSRFRSVLIHDHFSSSSSSFCAIFSYLGQSIRSFLHPMYPNCPTTRVYGVNCRRDPSSDRPNRPALFGQWTKTDSSCQSSISSRHPSMVSGNERSKCK